MAANQRPYGLSYPWRSRRTRSGCRRCAHNLLLLGSPGAGKSMLARRLTTILPIMTVAEALETTRLHRVAGLTSARTTLVTTRPCRAPHQTISDVGLIGGGQMPMPGEGSLAHHGGLFLDELPECRRYVLEVLRQPLEDGVVTIARAPMANSARCITRFCRRSLSGGCRS